MLRVPILRAVRPSRRRPERPPRPKWRAFHALAFSCLAGGLLSCAGSLPAYRARARWPHKDVAVLVIDLERELTAADYLRIAEREGARLPARSPDLEVPLYEVRFDFYVPAGPASFGRRLVAQVVWTPGTPISGARVSLY